MHVQEPVAKPSTSPLAAAWERRREHMVYLSIMFMACLYDYTAFGHMETECAINLVGKKCISL